jgi:RNA polymerase sigma-70 factor (ECF subfamily)
MKSAAPSSLGDRARRRTALMRRVQEGDADAYRALLDDIKPALLNLLRRWAANRDELQDLVQEVLLALHRSRHTYDPLQPFEPWLFSIARYIATRSQRRRMQRMSWEILVDVPPDQPSEPDFGTGSRFEEVLGQLPPAQREAFVLLKLEGLSVEEAAAQAGTTTAALKVRAHRAYAAIKALLRR